MDFVKFMSYAATMGCLLLTQLNVANAEVPCEDGAVYVCDGILCGCEPLCPEKDGASCGGVEFAWKVEEGEAGPKGVSNGDLSTREYEEEIVMAEIYIALLEEETRLSNDYRRSRRR